MSLLLIFTTFFFHIMETSSAASLNESEIEVKNKIILSSIDSELVRFYDYENRRKDFDNYTKLLLEILSRITPDGEEMIEHFFNDRDRVYAVKLNNVEDFSYFPEGVAGHFEIEAHDGNLFNKVIYLNASHDPIHALIILYHELVHAQSYIELREHNLSGDRKALVQFKFIDEHRAYLKDHLFVINLLNSVPDIGEYRLNFKGEYRRPFQVYAKQVDAKLNDFFDGSFNFSRWIADVYIQIGEYKSEYIYLDSEKKVFLPQLKEQINEIKDQFTYERDIIGKVLRLELMTEIIDEEKYLGIINEVNHIAHLINNHFEGDFRNVSELDFLNALHQILYQELKFTQRGGINFSTTLLGRSIDCDAFSLLAIGIGEIFGYQFYAANLPRHMILMSEQNNQWRYFESQAPRLTEKTPEEYQKIFKVDEKLFGNIYLRPLSHDELYATFLAKIGVSHFLAFRPEKSVEFSLKSLDIYPSYILALQNLGVTYLLDLEDDEKALSTFDRLLELDPNNAQANHTLGVHFMDSESPKELLKAKDLLQRAYNHEFEAMRRNQIEEDIKYIEEHLQSLESALN